MKALLIVALLLILLLLGLHLGGVHPGDHALAGAIGGHEAPTGSQE